MLLILIKTGAIINNVTDCQLYFLTGERVCDVAFWKEQLLVEIGLMETECVNLQVCHIQAAAYETK